MEGLRGGGIPESWDGAECYVGFDMSAKIDLTSIAVVVPVMTDGRVVYWIHSHSFVPSREKLLSAGQKTKRPTTSGRRRGISP